jgi:hypothetical protein
MTHLSGDVSLTSDQRLFEPMKHIILVIDAICTAVAVLSKGKGKPSPGSLVNCCHARQFYLNVQLPLGSPIQTMVDNKEPTHIEVGFHPVGELAQGLTHETKFYPSVFINVINPVYVDFFEKHRPWMVRTYGTDPDTWPPLLNFTRMIRNWISHHRGCVHFMNSERPPISWHHLTYGPDDEGKAVVGGDLELGDMIVLLFELAEELDRLGCPANPEGGF